MRDNIHESKRDSRRQSVAIFSSLEKYSENESGLLGIDEIAVGDDDVFVPVVGTRLEAVGGNLLVEPDTDDIPSLPNPNLDDVPEDVNLRNYEDTQVGVKYTSRLREDFDAVEEEEGGGGDGLGEGLGGVGREDSWLISSGGSPAQLGRLDLFETSTDATDKLSLKYDANSALLEKVCMSGGKMGMGVLSKKDSGVAGIEKEDEEENKTIDKSNVLQRRFGSKLKPPSGRSCFFSNMATGGQAAQTAKKPEGGAPVQAVSLHTSSQDKSLKSLRNTRVEKNPSVDEEKKESTDSLLIRAGQTNNHMRRIGGELRPPKKKESTKIPRLKISHRLYNNTNQSAPLMCVEAANISKADTMACPPPAEPTTESHDATCDQTNSADSPRTARLKWLESNPELAFAGGCTLSSSPEVHLQTKRKTAEQLHFESWGTNLPALNERL